VNVGLPRIARFSVAICMGVSLIPASGIAQTGSVAGPARRLNILLIIGDDIGNEILSCYGLNDNAASTPTLDDLCGQGVRFDNLRSPFDGQRSTGSGVR